MKKSEMIKCNKLNNAGRGLKAACITLLSASLLCITSQNLSAQSAPKKVEVPDWALPGSATHTQVPPPANFHRTTLTSKTHIGIFEGQSDVGAALVPGSSSYNAKTKQYTIASAGYNVWYTRDEFRYLWRKMSVDVSLATNVDFPDPLGYNDRKVLVVIRQDLNDDAKEAMVALHGAGLMHLAWRPEKGENIKEMRVDVNSLVKNKGTDVNEVIHAKRIGIEKHGDEFSVFVSISGEPMHRYGDPIHLHLDGPFYVGIGFCSHQPDKVDTGIMSEVVLENSAGKVH
jgi:hypothetical protein